MPKDPEYRLLCIGFRMTKKECFFSVCNKGRKSLSLKGEQIRLPGEEREVH